MANILVIDDDEPMRNILQYNLSREGHQIALAENGAIGLNLIEEQKPDLVICDLMMPEINGLEVLENIKQIDSDIQVILITAFENMDTTIQAMQKGAFDYISKPIDHTQLKLRIDKALQNRNISQRLKAYIEDDSSEYQLEQSLIGKTDSMREIYKKIGQISLNRVSVLLQGESGTGKELIAKVIHYSGVTKEHPFIAVNCTALSESLLESELFGHERGAFTGAVREKQGKFELAGEGTIFIDEASEMSWNVQTKLLRVLQEREFERVGGDKTIPMNARVIAASNRGLQQLVEDGKFREDLYYRLRVFQIDLPPLRERREDIPLLITHFLKKINKELHKNITKVPFDVMETLQNHEWVGNVRELENTLMQAAVLTKNDVLTSENILLSKSKKKTGAQQGGGYDSNMSIEDVVKNHIQQVLDYVNWDKKKAIQILQISKPTLYQKIEKYNLKPSGD